GRRLEVGEVTDPRKHSMASPRDRVAHEAMHLHARLVVLAHDEEGWHGQLPESWRERGGGRPLRQGLARGVGQAPRAVGDAAGAGPRPTYLAKRGFDRAASAKASSPSRSSASAKAWTVATQFAVSSDPAPVSATMSALTISGYARAKFSAIFPPIERPPRTARGISRWPRSARRSATEIGWE